MDEGSAKVIHRFRIADQISYDVHTFAGCGLRKTGYLSTSDRTQAPIWNADSILLHNGTMHMSLHSLGGVGWLDDS